MRVEQALTPEQFEAIKGFADGLKGCLVAAKKDSYDANLALSYVISLIDLHVQIKELDVNRWDYEVEQNRLSEELEKKT